MAIISYVVSGAFVACISAFGIYGFGSMAYGILKGMDN